MNPLDPSILGIDIDFDENFQFGGDTYTTQAKIICQELSVLTGLKNTELNERGLRYLLRHTHILRYAKVVDGMLQVEDSTFIDAIMCVSFALFLSGQDNVLNIGPDQIEKDFYILDGTNLCLNANVKQARVITFNAWRGTIVCGAQTVSHREIGNLHIFSVVSGDAEFDLLSYDEATGFIYFFIEQDASNSHVDRYLIESINEIEDELRVLSECKNAIIKLNINIWDSILRHVSYVSFTRIEGFESSTNPMELRNSIIINMHWDIDMTLSERIAWISNGLYHEAKHNQFIDAFYLDTCPSSADQALKSILEIEPVSVIATWKALPQNRTLTQILLGIHAFIPGLYLCFKILKQKQQAQGKWIKDRIETEMRSTNGGISIAMLGTPYLNEDGITLAKTLIDNAFDYLYPAYEDLYY